MKNRRSNLLRRASFAAPLIIALSASATAADLTWVGPNPGTWDVGTTANWSGDTTTWTNGDNAIFNAGTYTVNPADTGVTVGNLTYAGGGVLTLKSVTDNLGKITINPGGAAWNTGGGEIEFFNDNNTFDTPLAMTSGDTLTVTGGGTFDTGQNPDRSGLDRHRRHSRRHVSDHRPWQRRRHRSRPRSAALAGSPPSSLSPAAPISTSGTRTRITTTTGN